MMKVSEFLQTGANSLKAVAKMLVQSRPVIPPVKASGDTVVILANGPSLNDTITSYMPFLESVPLVAVNFMANAPQYKILKPEYYVLADPHFFEGLAHDNVKMLWNNLRTADYSMTLFVPASRRKQARELLGDNTKVKLATFNFVGIEGFAWLENFAFSHRLAMPRPRNVLVPAIMAAISAGFGTIYITGADHSWMETLRVSDDNRVLSIQPHFYKDDNKELERSATEYKGYRLHDILNSFMVAFRSYHQLQRYALSKGIQIYNATPHSYIDAFPRRGLE